MIKNYELLDVVKVPELFCNHSYISQVHHTYISTSVEGKEGGACVSCSVLIVIWPSFYQLTAITPAQNLEFLIL